MNSNKAFLTSRLCIITSPVGSKEDRLVSAMLVKIGDDRIWSEDYWKALSYCGRTAWPKTLG